MKNRVVTGVACALGLAVGAPAFAQSEDGLAEAAEDAAAEPAIAEAAAAPACELHVFPTENYLGFNSGLLSGFGALGAVADMAAHKGKVATVKDLMADYLGPDVQIAELEKLDYVNALGLSGYEVVVHEPTPANDDLKNNPELKASVKQLNKDLKAGKRITTSTNPCYAEFLITNIMYHKAMMYGSNLFVGTMLRDFTGGKAKPVQSVGAVKNPLEEFPPKTPEMVETAKIELRDAFAKDFTEWTEKKLVRGSSAGSK